MRRTILTGAASAVLVLGAAAPAMAEHDHKLITPGGCTTVPVAHQAHGEDDPGKKFHGGLHKGAADDDGVLGKGASRVLVFGGSC